MQIPKYATDKTIGIIRNGYIGTRAGEPAEMLSLAELAEMIRTGNGLSEGKGKRPCFTNVAYCLEQRIDSKTEAFPKMPFLCIDIDFSCEGKIDLYYPELRRDFQRIVFSHPSCIMAWLSDGKGIKAIFGSEPSSVALKAIEAFIVSNIDCNSEVPEWELDASCLQAERLQDICHDLGILRKWPNFEEFIATSSNEIREYAFATYAESNIAKVATLLQKPFRGMQAKNPLHVRGIGCGMAVAIPSVVAPCRIRFENLQSEEYYSSINRNNIIPEDIWGKSVGTATAEPVERSNAQGVSVHGNGWITLVSDSGFGKSEAIRTATEAIRRAFGFGKTIVAESAKTGEAMESIIHDSLTQPSAGKGAPPEPIEYPENIRFLIASDEAGEEMKASAMRGELTKLQSAKRMFCNGYLQISNSATNRNNRYRGMLKPCGCIVEGATKNSYNASLQGEDSEAGNSRRNIRFILSEDDMRNGNINPEICFRMKDFDSRCNALAVMIREAEGHSVPEYCISPSAYVLRSVVSFILKDFLGANAKTGSISAYMQHLARISASVAFWSLHKCIEIEDVYCALAILFGEIDSDNSLKECIPSNPSDFQRCVWRIRKSPEYRECGSIGFDALAEIIGQCRDGNREARLQWWIETGHLTICNNAETLQASRFILNVAGVPKATIGFPEGNGLIGHFRARKTIATQGRNLSALLSGKKGNRHSEACKLVAKMASNAKSAGMTLDECTEYIKRCIPADCDERQDRLKIVEDLVRCNFEKGWLQKEDYARFKTEGVLPD